MSEAMDGKESWGVSFSHWPLPGRRAAARLALTSHVTAALEPG